LILVKPRGALGGLLAGLAAALVVACSSVRQDVPRTPSHALEVPEQTSLGRSIATRLAAARGQSGFHLLVSGQDAFLARAALAESAERTLDLQYYIVAEDATATLLLYRALHAAQRGVRVRLLLDDIYAAGRDFDLAALAAHPNVQVRVFNPFLRRGPLGISQLLEYLGDSERLNRRMHNKLWIADNAAAVVGGRNLGDAYFQAQSEGDFADLDLLAGGPVVAHISRSFDDYWNSAWAVPIAAFLDAPPEGRRLELILSQMQARADRFRDTDYAAMLRTAGFGRAVRVGEFPLVSGPASALYDKPAKLDGASGADEGGIVPALRRLIESAQSEVILVSPYFIPSERGLEVLRTLTGRGVRVRVLTNSLASADPVPVAHAGYARYRARLLGRGVELHERRPGSRLQGSTRAALSSGATLHAKAVVVDRRFVLVGSMNLDPRSRHANTEVAVLVESEALAGQLAALFEEACTLDHAFRVELARPGDEDAPLAWTGREDGKPARYDREPLTSWWRRTFSRLLGLVAPEELL
jgi:putative cardiolipin synthase